MQNPHKKHCAKLQCPHCKPCPGSRRKSCAFGAFCLPGCQLLAQCRGAVPAQPYARQIPGRNAAPSDNAVRLPPRHGFYASTRLVSQLRQQADAVPSSRPHQRFVRRAVTALPSRPPSSRAIGSITLLPCQFTSPPASSDAPADKPCKHTASPARTEAASPALMMRQNRSGYCRPRCSRHTGHRPHEAQRQRAVCVKNAHRQQRHTASPHRSQRRPTAQQPLSFGAALGDLRRFFPKTPPAQSTLCKGRGLLSYFLTGQLFAVLTGVQLLHRRIAERRKRIFVRSLPVSITRVSSPCRQWRRQCQQYRRWW